MPRPPRLFLLALPFLLASFAADAGTNVSGDITSDTTWTLAGSPYNLSGDVSVGGSAGPTLTIDPGVVVTAGAGTHLRINVRDRGALVVRGTAAAPVLFRGNGSPWKGIHFGAVAGAPPSALSHVIIQSSEQAAIHFDGGAATLTDVAFVRNRGAAVSATPDARLSGMTGLSASGNGTDAIVYRAGTMAGARTWKSCALPYVVAGNIDVHGDLTIEAGNTIRFARRARITVGPEHHGSLRADGTAGAPILFTANSDAPEPGDWSGLVFGSGSTGSALTHAIVEYAGHPGAQRGGVTIHAGAPVFAHVLIHHSAFAGVAMHGGAATFSGSTITANAGPGIYASNAVTLTLSDLALTNNDGYAISALASSTFQDMTGFVASGNGTGRDGIEIRQNAVMRDLCLRGWTPLCPPLMRWDPSSRRLAAVTETRSWHW